MDILNRLVEALFMPITVFAFFLTFGFAVNPKIIKRWVLLLVFTLIILFTIKYGLDTSRPEGARSKTTSFPSIHTALAVYAVLAVEQIAKVKFIYFLWLMPIFVGFSRVASGEHYILDVLGGGVLAFLIVKIALKYLYTNSSYEGN